MSHLPVFQLNLAETFPHLAAAPIAEAVIHWRARAGKWPTSNDLKQRLIDTLPDYPEIQPQHQLEFAAEIANDRTATQRHRDTWLGFRLTSADKRYVVQFTRDGIVFSRLTPYEEWDRFVSEGWRLWQIFMKLVEPSEVQRLGVRFINRVPLREPREVHDYLTSPPECLEAIGLPTAGFLYQSRHTVPGHPFEVNVVRTIQPPTPQQSDGYGLIVDIDVGVTRSMPCEEAALRERLQQMHWLKNKVFFNLLSDLAIESFKKGAS